MSIQRFVLLAALSMLVIVCPVSGEEASAAHSTTEVNPAITPVVEEADAAEVPTPIANESSDKAVDLSVMKMLGFVLPILVEPSASEFSHVELGGAIAGYCYHDCSDCNTRADCVEPGFPFGWPCTQIPLC